MKCKLSWQIVIIFSCLLFNCNTHKQDYKVLHQVTGPIETNCYLLYDVKSKEAALIDVGGTIDSLIDYIEDNNLRLKYIFATHCHMDHIGGLPEIREKFPDAQLCLNEADYDDCFKFPQWLEENMDSAEVAYMKNDPEMGKWFTYKRSMFGEPDILLDDNQVYKGMFYFQGIYCFTDKWVVLIYSVDPMKPLLIQCEGYTMNCRMKPSFIPDMVSLRT